MGDEVIVATPTSSTAYSFATVGPIVSPRLGAWVVIPLAPHGTCHGSFVWSGEQTMTVDVLHSGGQVAVALDGLAGTATPGDTITLTGTQRIAPWPVPDRLVGPWRSANGARSGPARARSGVQHRIILHLAWHLCTGHPLKPVAATQEHIQAAGEDDHH